MENRLHRAGLRGDQGHTDIDWTNNQAITKNLTEK